MAKSSEREVFNSQLDIVSNPGERTALEDRIARSLPDFTPNDTRLASYILEYPNDAAFLSSAGLSREIGVSESAVSRFIRAAGFSSFAEFRSTLAQHLHHKLGMASRMDKRLEDVESQEDFFPSLINSEIEYLQKSLQKITSADLDRCAETICGADRVFIGGHRVSLPIREILDFRLSRFKIRTTHLNDCDRYILEKARQISQNDVVLAVTFQRIPNDLRVLLELASERNCPVILLTDLTLVPKTLNIDIVLTASRGPQKLSSSYTVPVAIANAIVWAVARRLGEQGHGALAELDELRRRFGSESSKLTI